MTWHFSTQDTHGGPRSGHGGRVDLRLCFSMLIRRDIEGNSSDLGWAAIATKLGSFCKFAIEDDPLGPVANTRAPTFPAA